MLTSIRTGDFDAINFTYGVWFHKIGPKVFYIGSGRLNEALSVSNVSNNRAWLERVKNYGGGKVEIEIVEIFQDLLSARKAAFQYRVKHRMTLIMHNPRNMRGEVRLVSTGEKFPNGNRAAQTYGISPSAMSNHLNRRKGYERIHNMVFERILPDVPAPRPHPYAEELAKPVAPPPLVMQQLARPFTPMTPQQPSQPGIPALQWPQPPQAMPYTPDIRDHIEAGNVTHADTSQEFNPDELEIDPPQFYNGKWGFYNLMGAWEAYDTETECNAAYTEARKDL